MDAPVETIFAECLRALKRLNAYALEFDVTQRYLEATLELSLNSLGGTLCIQIEQGKDQHYAICCFAGVCSSGVVDDRNSFRSIRIIG